MRTWHRTYIYLLLTVIAVSACAVQATASNTTHIYTGGVIQDTANEELVIRGRRYTLHPSCKVLILEKRNGSYYEDAGQRSDLRSGLLVRIKAEATTVYEVLIERWKQ